MRNHMDAQWYYNVAGQVCGPIATDALIDLVRRRKLFADELVRLGLDGGWLFAGDIDGLFVDESDSPVPTRTSTNSNCQRPQSTSTPSLSSQKHHSTASVETAAIAASHILGQRHAPRIRGQAEQTRSGLFDIVAITFQTVIDRSAGCSTFIRSCTRLARSAATSKTGATVVGMLILIVIIAKLPPARITARDPYVVFTALWVQLQELRRSDANDAVWREFTARAHNELRPLVKRLEQDATARDERTLALLWAGRDYLPRLLKDSRTNTASESERLFEAQLATVQRIDSEQQLSKVNVKNETIAMITIDACFLVGLIAFIVSRRSKGRAR